MTYRIRREYRAGNYDHATDPNSGFLQGRHARPAPRLASCPERPGPMNSVNSGFRFAVMWRVAAALPRLRTLSRADVLRIGQEASDACEQQPMHLTDRTFLLPAWNPETPRSGAQVVALMLACLWVACEEDERQAAALLADWPELPCYAALSRGEQPNLPGGTP